METIKINKQIQACILGALYKTYPEPNESFFIDFDSGECEELNVLETTEEILIANLFYLQEKGFVTHFFTQGTRPNVALGRVTAEGIDWLVKSSYFNQYVVD